MPPRLLSRRTDIERHSLDIPRGSGNRLVPWLVYAPLRAALRRLGRAGGGFCSCSSCSLCGFFATHGRSWRHPVSAVLPPTGDHLACLSSLRPRVCQLTPDVAIHLTCEQASFPTIANSQDKGIHHFAGRLWLTRTVSRGW